jgi:flagellar protein FlgJ
MSDIKIQKYMPVQPKPEDFDQKIKDASKMYERHFLNEMVKAMRSTVQPTDNPSMANRIFTDKMFDEYTDKWSDAGGVGLSNIIYNQIRERFFPGKPVDRPMGPIPMNKGTTIKVDETKNFGIPVIEQGGGKKTDMSYLLEWPEADSEIKELVNPWDAKVLQAFNNGDERQVIKLQHDNGLVSTLSYLGRANDFEQGQKINAGEKLGTIAAYAKGLTWQMVQVEQEG